MKYNSLGNTGLKVSEIGLGCEGFAQNDGKDAMLYFDAAEKAGINYFDLYTPDPAARGAAGDALVGRRDKFIIQSHICSVWKDGQYKRTRNLEEVKKGFEESLELLKTDFIDVGMIHYCDSLSDWEEIVKEGGVLDYAKQLKREGKIGHIGLSSHNPEVGIAAVETGEVEVLMFSINPCYDLQPPSENVEDIWADEAYSKDLLNMDPTRQKLYELCQSRGVGITIMKCFGGGDLLDEKLSPAGAALTPYNCISYALSRPAVATILTGARNIDELNDAIMYEYASDEEKDYAEALSKFPHISWSGHCMYCSHCGPCTQKIDIANVTKFLNLTKAQGEVPETVREHYYALDHHASECTSCGACEMRCPFDVNIRANMKEASKVFGF